MKRIILYAIAFLFIQTAFAQKYVPTIKEGSVITYDVNYSGQPLIFVLEIKSLADPVKMDWDVQGTGGSFEMPQKALTAGISFNPDPVQGGVKKLTDTETFCAISQTAFKTLTSTKAFTYSGIDYSLKDTDRYKLTGKDADALHVVSADGKTEQWILNNPAFPVLLKIKGNPTGLDFAVSEIKE